jgi:hypothetical protein
MDFLDETPWDRHKREEDGDEGGNDTDEKQLRRWEAGLRIEPTMDLYHAYTRFQMDRATAERKVAMKAGKVFEEPELVSFADFPRFIEVRKDDDAEELYLATIRWKMGFKRYCEELDQIDEKMDQFSAGIHDWMESTGNILDEPFIEEGDETGSDEWEM